MKRISLVIVMIVAILLSACTDNDRPTVASTPQIPDTNKISPQVSPTISTKLTTETPGPSPSSSPTPSPTISEELTTEDLKQYLNMKMSGVMETFDADLGPGTLTIMESYMVFPAIYAESLGLTFIFPSDFEDLRPLYIEVNSNNVSINGAEPGMNFGEIMDKLGGQVTETWIANEECIYYQIVYKTDGLVYHFVSHDEEGTYTWLYVSLDQ